MTRCKLSFFLVVAAIVFFGCKTDRHSATFGNYKVIYGEMGPVAQRWEAIKAGVTGWEVVTEADDEEGGVLVLHKRK